MYVWLEVESENCRLKMAKRALAPAENNEKELQKRVTSTENEKKIVDEGEYSDPETDEEEEEVVDQYFDAKNWDKPHMMPMYAERVKETMTQMESSLILKTDAFARIQEGTTVTEDVRNRAVEFIINLCHAYTFDPATISNAVLIFDRSLAAAPANRSEVKLMAAVCVLISAKANELGFPSIADINKNCAITKENDQEPWEICERKIFILNQFNIVHPTIELFTARYLNYVDADAALIDTVGLMCEAALLSFKYNEYRRSTLGFAIVVSAAVSIGASIRILYFMACAHLCDYSDVLECCKYVLNITDTVLKGGAPPVYARHIAAAPAASPLKSLVCNEQTLQKIRELLASTKLNVF